MGPAYFVMAILGCGDAGTLCSEARVLPVRYTSIQACQAAAPAILQRNTDLDFPELSASCRSNTPQIAANGRTPRG